MSISKIGQSRRLSRRDQFQRITSAMTPPKPEPNTSGKNPLWSERKDLWKEHENVDKTAYISHGALIDDNVHVGAHARLLHGAIVQSGSKVLAGATIGVDAEIGRGVIIGYGAIIGASAVINDGAYIGNGVHIKSREVVKRGEVRRITAQPLADDQEDPE